MRLVGVNSLLQGDTLALPVSSISGKIILNGGATLSANYIDKLKQLKIPHVYINDGRFDDVEIGQHMDMKSIARGMEITRNAYTQLHQSKAINEYPLMDFSKEIIEYVRNCRDKGINFISTSVIDDYIIGHSINVAILTAFLGNHMNYNYSQLCDLVTAALIHDLGRVGTQDEKPEHCQKGFDAMRKCRGLNLHSSIVCYEHHENFDGSGYPRKIKEKAISEFSRAVRVCDMYDHLLHDYGDHGKPLLPYEAYEYLLAVTNTVLDPEIVQRFRETIVFYPSGSTVLLTNGLKGVVIRQNQGNPQRPVVRIYNETSVIGEIDLLKSLTINIKEIIIS